MVEIHVIRETNAAVALNIHTSNSGSSMKRKVGGDRQTNMKVSAGLDHKLDPQLKLSSIMGFKYVVYFSALPVLYHTCCLPPALRNLCYLLC